MLPAEFILNPSAIAADGLDRHNIDPLCPLEAGRSPDRWFGLPTGFYGETRWGVQRSPSKNLDSAKFCSRAIKTFLPAMSVPIRALGLCAMLLISPVVSAESARRVCIQRISENGKPEGSVRILFDDAEIYEVNGEDSRFITIYGVSTVTLLDQRSQVQCSIPIEELRATENRAMEVARKRPNPEVLGIDVEPEVSGDSYAIGFGKKEQRVQYRVEAEKADDGGFAKNYSRFADSALRLSLAKGQSPLPPFARFRLNKALAKDGKTPRKVEIVLTAGAVERRMVVRTDHSAFDEQAKKDVAIFEGMRKLYRTVSWDQFFAGK